MQAGRQAGTEEISGYSTVVALEELYDAREYGVKGQPVTDNNSGEKDTLLLLTPRMPLVLVMEKEKVREIWSSR